MPAPVPPRPAAWGAWRRLGWLARFTAGELRRNPGTTVAAGGMVALFVVLLGLALLAREQAGLLGEFVRAGADDQGPGGPGGPGGRYAPFVADLLTPALTVLRWLAWCLAAFAGLLGVAAVAVVAAETAVIAETRREQVRVMRLVGASATFVRLSFLAQWLLVALVASGAGLAGLWALVAAANARRGLLPGRLAGLALVGPAEVAHLAPLLLAGAAAACLVAATLALPRH